MADYTLSAKITGDSRSFNSAFDEAKSKLEGLSNNVKGFGDKLKSGGKQMMGAGAKASAAAVPIALMGRKVIQTGMDFESSMSNVAAVSGATGKDLDSLRAIALEMGSSTVHSASDSANALSYMALAGWETEAMIAGLPGVLNLATAGALDLGNASDIVTDTMSVFQMEAKEAGKASDIFAYAQSNANTNVEQLGEALTKAGPAAAAAGMDLEQTSAVLALFADNGVKGSRAGTTMEAMLRDLRNSAEDGAIAVGDTSIAVYDAEGNMRSLTDVMADVESATAGMTGEQRDAALASIFQTQAMAGVNMILGEGTDKLYDLEHGLYNSNGAAQEAADIMGDNLAGSMAGLSAALEGLYISFYDIGSGPLRNLVDQAAELVRGLTDMDDKTKSIIGIIGLLAVAIGPALMLIGAMGLGVGSLVTLFGFLLSPIGLVITAIVGLGATFGVAMLKSEEFRERVFAVFEMVRGFITSAIETVRPILENMFTAGIEGAQTFADGIGGNLLSAFETIKGVIMTVAELVWQFASSIIEGFQGAGGQVNTLSTLFIAFNPILKLALMILTEFGPQIAAGFQEIASMAMPILMLLGETLGQLAAAIIPAVMNVVATLIPVIITLGTAIMEIVMAVLPILLNLFQQIVPIVMQLVTTVISLVGQLAPLVSILIGALVPVLMTVIDVILNIVQAVAPALIAILGLVVAAFQAIIPIVVSVLTTIVQVMANIMAAIQPIVAFVGGIISSIMSIIAPIVTFIAGTIASIMNVITPIIAFTTGVFNSVFSIISGVFRSATQFISSAISTISGIISALSGTVSGVFNSIFATISSVMNMVSSTISGVFTAIQTSWTGLQTFVSGVFSGISSSIQTLVGQVKGFVNGVIGGINSAIGLINKIPGVSIGKIPMLYRGTDDWEGGFARINEGGRGELVHLPNGAQVVPHDVSMRYAREAGRRSSEQGVTVAGGQDTSRMEHLLERLLDKDQSLVLDTGALVGGTYDRHDQYGGNKTALHGRWGRS
jgi:TP901 family phage tail tape measure protein